MVDNHLEVDMGQPDLSLMDASTLAEILWSENQNQPYSPDQPYSELVWDPLDDCR
jgi:hypothetical protein